MKAFTDRVNAALPVDTPDPILLSLVRAHPGDASAQYCGTLLSIAALLEQEGASLSAIAQGTLFAKTAAAARACRDASRRLCMPELPLVEVVADVCRPELLVEVEAVAIV